MGYLCLMLWVQRWIRTHPRLDLSSFHSTSSDYASINVTGLTNLVTQSQSLDSAQGSGVGILAPSPSHTSCLMAGILSLFSSPLKRHLLRGPSLATKLKFQLPSNTKSSQHPSLLDFPLSFPFPPQHTVSFTYLLSCVFPASSIRM